MGFAATGDSIYLCDDMALQYVLNCVKVVDGVLLYDKDYLIHLHRINDVLSRFMAHGIALDAKFAVA